MAGRRHPPAPWRLRGRALLLPGVVRVADGGAAVPLLRTPAGRTLGGLLLADYGRGSTLAYHELLGVGGLIRSGLLPAAWIAHAYVDDAASIAGGRAVWGIPKLHARFRWQEEARGGRVSVSVDERRLVSVSFATRPRGLWVPVAAPFVGRDGGERAWVRGRLRATPVRAQVDIPPESPLASPVASFASIALVGDVALHVGTPRSRRSH